MNIQANKNSNLAMIVTGIALAGAALGATLWNLFRRRIPDLTPEDLLDDPTNDLKIVRKFTEEDKAGLKEAFGKSPDFVWVLKDGDKLEEEDAEDMAALTSYLMDIIIYFAENYGYIIKSVDEDGNYQGSITLMPPISSFLSKVYLAGAIANAGLPPSAVWNDPGRWARFNAFGDDTAKQHHEVMHDCLEDHWYLLSIGVAPSAQGKRVGSRLMKQVIHLAGDKPLYLDCHNDNVAYYEKFKFYTKNFAFQPPKGTSKTTFYFNAMRRDPQ